MKNFSYRGNGILAFSHQDTDYIVNQEGPHALPDDNDLVQSLVKQELLIEVQDVEITQQKNLLNKRI